MAVEGKTGTADRKMNLLKAYNLLKEKGLKTTPQRIAILDIIWAMGDHFTAEQIFEEVKKKLPYLSLTTIYRNLKEFEEKGIISSLTLSDRYMIFDPNPEPHHHFLCVKCGKIEDIPPDLIKVDIKLKGKQVKKFAVAVKGLCEKCAKGK